MKELTLEAIIDNVPQVTAFVEQQLEELDCSPKVMMQISVAIDEIFGNIAYYAYGPAGGQATVQVETEPEKPAVVITFIDQGKPYNPLEKEDPDVTLSAAERKIGGLGIFLVKNIMDSVEYEYRQGQNVLRLRKLLD